MTMKNKKHKKQTWGLKTNLNKLPLIERRDSLVLLYFLNEYQEQQKAFERLKAIWINNLYKLPKTSSESYNSIKNGRHRVLSRMKRIHDKYMVRLRP